ncbi:hypothetical protein CASFOL_005211 [Castilleja foliolosa]|uniref:Cellulose synthase-like protein G2 n=1 Tax=Castilleja foliolosa TaxID=1961234 RepID=A0ABD3E2T4_9LAMI
MEKKSSLPLNLCHVMKTEMIINRLYMLFLGISLIALFYYRITNLSHIIKTNQKSLLIPHLLIFISELLFTFHWILHQAFRWRPVTRTVNLPGRDNDVNLPSIDVFVCTADPSKEPSLGVMNTVISAMALDYPPDKLSVYLSDDGGSFVTLRTMKEAWGFSKWWLPFCKKYEVRNRCPEAYFSGSESDDEFVSSREFKLYGEFKDSLNKITVNASSCASRDHAPIIEVLSDSSQHSMPRLVYVAREKRPSYPHHFKAGALNALVSAVMSNAPYILVLDCDHYCNDPTSARQAMCFYLDPQVSSKLAWVQFPQKFHNMSDHDLYDGRIYYYWRRWHGIDGVGGPMISGSNTYLKRESLYGNKNINKNAFDFNDMKKSFGSSNELIKSIYENYKPHSSEKETRVSGALKNEVQLIASCSYDSHSKWGKEVGFIYASVVEDVMTGLYLHRQGWVSVWLDPPRPCFLGTCPTNLSDMLVQQARWGLGQLQISVSKYCALVYGISRMPILQCMCYTAATFDPLYVFPFYGLCVVPQICLLNGIPLYPKVSDPIFVVFVFIFLASQLKHVQEVVFYGDSIRTALYELRVWMMKSASCYLYAVLGAFLDNIGLQEASFNLTNKVADDEQDERFKKGIYDFRGSPMLITPICSLYVLNVFSFVIGIARFVQSHKAINELFVQAFIPLFGIVVKYHVFEGMVLRKDKGRVSPFVTLVSIAIATFILCFGSLVLIY